MKRMTSAKKVWTVRFKMAAQVVGKAEGSSARAGTQQHPEKSAEAKQLRKLAEYKVSYLKERDKILGTQKQQLTVLKREHAEYTTTLRVSRKNEQKDLQGLKLLKDLMARMDRMDDEKKRLKRELEALRRELRETDREIDLHRKLRASAREAVLLASKRTKSLAHVENDQEKETIKYDTCLAELKVMRDEASHLQFTREQLKQQIRDLEADLKRLTYTLGKEVQMASQNLEAALNCKANKKILEKALAKKRKDFKMSLKMLERNSQQERLLWKFVANKNKRREDCCHEIDHKLCCRHAANSIQEITKYSQALDDLKNAFDRMHGPGEGEANEEENSKAQTPANPDEGALSQEKSRNEQTIVVRDVEELRTKTAAQAIRERLGDEGLQTILEWFQELLTENRKMFWRVSVNYELAKDLQAQRKELVDKVTHMCADHVRATLLPMLRLARLQATLQAEKETLDKTNKELKRQDDVIHSYAVPLRALMRNVGITEHEFARLTAPHNAVNARTILQCFGAVERAVDALRYQETLEEYTQFLPLLEAARARDDETLPVPSPRPPTMHLTQSYTVLPPHLPEDEDTLFDLDQLDHTVGTDDFEFNSTIPLPPDWEERPLSREELLDHLAAHMEEACNTETMVTLFHPVSNI